MSKAFPIIGLEIHVELKTKSKMFCQCSADYFGQKPNSHVCPVCLGMPGALPVPNKTAVEWTIKIARALNCEVKDTSKFDRKHYFYADLPKGYQISQYDEPIGQNGHLDIVDENGEVKTFRFRRIHLEEDTGKLIHSGNESLIDFNRSSVPLVELVTEADFHNSEDVRRFLEELQVIIRYLDVANADMEKGDMRLEPNISVTFLKEGEKWDGKTFPKYKVEVKNINSFRYAKAAIDYELERQTEMLERGETPVQETRGFNENKNITVSQRVKEEAADYRYFPEPDIPTLRFSKELIESIENTIPELPEAKIERYKKDFGLRYMDAFQITRNSEFAEVYEQVIAKLGKDKAQKVANLLINKKVSAEGSVEHIIKKIESLTAEKKTDLTLLTNVIEEICAANEKAVTEYKSGKENAIMFLLGQVMRQMKGQADANTVKEELTKFLS